MGESPVLVCDAPEGLEALARVVGARGYPVERASDGYRAVELAVRTRPAVIVVRSGVQGPGTQELVRRLKAASKAAAVLVVLAEESVEEAADALRAGADGVLLPDPPPTFLLWAIEEALGGGTVLSPRLTRDLAERFADAVHRERQWARTLADSAQQAEELSRTKADFLANVSHELRTPLTIIKGMAALVQRADPSPEERAELLAKVEESADKLTRMVENLVTLSEMERGAFQLSVEECNLADVVREGAAEGAGRYPQITIEVVVPARLPARADPERLREVVRHLVDNACRYSDPGGTVTVRAKSADEGITVHVVDAGSGLGRNIAQQAFREAFTPGEEILTKERAGLGLGLNLARNLVLLHGGIIYAEPLPGGGTRVSFALPPEGKGEPPSPPEGDQRAPSRTRSSS